MGAIGAFVVFLVGTAAPRSMIVWTFAHQPAGVVHVDSLVATHQGFALLSGPETGGTVLWTSTNGISWSERPIPGAPTRLVVADDGLLAFAGRWVMAVPGEGERPVSRIDLPLLVRVGYGSGRAGLVGGSGGLVAQAFTGDVFWAKDGAPFEVVVSAPQWGEATGMPAEDNCDPPTVSSVDVPPLVSTPDGFITLVSLNGNDPFGIWPVCQPEVWAAPDGTTWRLISEGSPFEPGAYIYDVAWRDGRLLAVGGVGVDQPAMWISDDGRSWDRLKPLPAEHPYELREVAAGGLGWVVLGEWAARPGLTGWVSP
ncbi:MAG: hypothetical protein ACRDWH_06430, partial [Acidimicrobiia bacterium]